MFANIYWPDSEHFIRVLIAIVLGGVIGLERELQDKPAGFRTMTLICLGACTFTLLSQMITTDPARIAAQIIAGIGFLGAGAILRSEKHVFGLTTAATTWTVAAIGMAVGFGHVAVGVLTTLGTLVTLLVLESAAKWISEWRDVQHYLVAMANTEHSAERIAALFRDGNLRIQESSCYEQGPLIVFQVRAIGAKADHQRLRFAIARSEEYTLQKH